MRYPTVHAMSSSRPSQRVRPIFIFVITFSISAFCRLEAFSHRLGTFLHSHQRSGCLLYNRQMLLSKKPGNNTSVSTPSPRTSNRASLLASHIPLLSALQHDSPCVFPPVPQRLGTRTNIAVQSVSKPHRTQIQKRMLCMEIAPATTPSDLAFFCCVLSACLRLVFA